MTGLEIFTWITGVASLIGLFIQIRDGFPGHREVRKAIVLILLGFFAGLASAALMKVQVTLADPISGFTIFIGVIVAILALTALVAIFSTDATRRNELFSVCGTGFFFILVVFFFRFISDPPARLTLADEEYLVLAEDNIARRNYARGIAFLTILYNRIPEKDPRNDAILKKIEAAKVAQVEKRR